MKNIKLSTQAWKKSQKIIEAIIHHPFNQALIKSCLDSKIFLYYIEQDIYYLDVFSRCHALIAGRIDKKYRRAFLKYAESAFVEQEMVHDFFIKLLNKDVNIDQDINIFNKNIEKNIEKKESLTVSTISYTNYLLSTCALAPVEVAVAAILPCFWVYREVGLFIAKHAVAENNRYSHWIKTYSSEEFSELVNEVIHIFDTLGQEASSKTREEMCDAFYKSTCLEWHFWNDVYQKNLITDVVNIPGFY
jgi:thiaminase/transcriptional activator TenA